MKKVGGQFTQLDGREYYKIASCDKLEPFLFTLASSNDIWIYLSSNGGVTAGRMSAERAFFPYLTEDRLYHSTDTGAKALIKIKKDGKVRTWQPFAQSLIESYDVIRNVYKSVLGNEAIFEEINLDLGVTYRYSWQSCEKYGIVRKITLLSDGDAEAEVMDGMLNILPFGIRSSYQLELPCLGDAYKSAEIVGGNMAVFALTSAINEKPTPEEMLRCNAAWAIADFDYDIYLSETALKQFLSDNLKSSGASYGERGAFLLRFDCKLNAGKELSWYNIADVGLSHKDVSKIAKGISLDEVKADLAVSELDLRRIIAKADGLQCTGNRVSSVHHMSNVTFNNMRGGLFLNGYTVDRGDFIGFIESRNKPVLSANKQFFESLPEKITIQELKSSALETGNRDIARLCFEYVPISFSRRHGDPSRPWNTFSIVLKDENGNPRTNYEGNWRDIFQNWEAMCLSFPQYIDNVIAIFLDASTADGYNPFRVARGGIDWEVAKPNDPDSPQGYWGDHQIIYLTRLIEWLDKYDRSGLDRLVKNGAFSYADVPYEISYFEDILKNPKSTITLNREKNDYLRSTSAEKGSDFRLLCYDGEVYHATFAEKIAVPVLEKMSNLVIGGGIWMNTEHPEWNDANNAIVGYGLSVVTACHLRRHLALCGELFGRYSGMSFEITNEVAAWLDGSLEVLEKYYDSAIKGEQTEALRLDFLRDMGRVLDEYKKVLYHGRFSGKTQYSYDRLCKFFSLSLEYVSGTISSNKTEGGFYHSYNLLYNTGSGIEVRRLFPMLEGQVAVLGCELLGGSEACELIDKMEESALWSERDKSFYLYPIKMTKLFMENNCLTKEQISRSELIKKLISEGDETLVITDAMGNVRFAPAVISGAAAKAVLEVLSRDSRFAELVKTDTENVLNTVEEQFRHFEFTGRSQIMYKYEGIGSIYWHQNSKLLVSMQESYFAAVGKESPEVVAELEERYYRIRSGLGFYKEPEVWGAFPQDAYSHTPFGGGAKQPGMTGQVKEEIITRFGELGVRPMAGTVLFDTSLVAENEYLTEDEAYEFIRQSGEQERILLKKGQLAFSFCQTPVIYSKDGMSGICITYSDGKTEMLPTEPLPRETAKHIFDRDGAVSLVTVHC